jgi:hypothetical protein
MKSKILADAIQWKIEQRNTFIDISGRLRRMMVNQSFRNQADIWIREAEAVWRTYEDSLSQGKPPINREWFGPKYLMSRVFYPMIPEPHIWMMLCGACHDIIHPSDPVLPRPPMGLWTILIPDVNQVRLLSQELRIYIDLLEQAAISFVSTTDPSKAKPGLETTMDSMITKGPQFWIFRYGSKDSMVQADLKGLKLLEILLRNKNRDYYPTELLRGAFPPQDGTIRTLSDGESMDEQLSNGDGISSDEAIKIRDRDKKSVERALSKVFGKINYPELRNHFERCIQTGTIVCYKPDCSISWIIA